MPTAAGDVVTLETVTVAYGKNHALRDVTADVRRRAPSGCSVRTAPARAR